MPLTHLAGYSLIAPLIGTFASGVLFSRISIKYINKNMEKDDVDPPSWDRGIGASVSFYIFAMFFERSRNQHQSLMDVLQPSMQGPVDKVIGATHLVSVTGMMLCLCIVIYFSVG